MRRIDRVLQNAEAAEQLADRYGEARALLLQLAADARWLVERATFVDEDIDTEDLE